MFKTIALNKRLSRETVGHVHRYLFDFGQGAQRVFWIGERAYLETDCMADITLLQEQFPTMIEEKFDTDPNDFPG